MIKKVKLSLDVLERLSFDVLHGNGFSKQHAKVIADFVTMAQLDDCHSHGIYRLLNCVHTLKSHQVSPNALPIIDTQCPTLVRADAQGAFSLLAFKQALPHLVEKTKKYGMSVMIINHCYHFSALWPEVETMSKHGLVAIAMNPSHSCVAPAGGHKPVFGTNPMAFAWPRENKNPYVFDFATSEVARGEIELYRREDKAIPQNWGVDIHGTPTTDAKLALEGAMLTFGGYKGSAIATMIELMAGAMIGDFTSMQSLKYDNSANAIPYHGELILAFDPHFFAGNMYESGMAAGEEVFEAITRQGARLPSQRRYKARAINTENGYVLVSEQLLQDVQALL